MYEEIKDQMCDVCHKMSQPMTAMYPLSLRMEHFLQRRRESARAS